MARLYGDKVLIEDVRVSKCGACGAEMLGEKEYERVRALVHKIQQKTPQPLLAAVKYFVV